MIAAAGVQYQELPITAKWAGVNDPTVAWGGDLRPGAGGDGESLLGSAEAVGGAKLADSHAVHRQAQVPACGSERYRRGEAAGIVERGDVGSPLLGGAGGDVSRAGGAVEARFELADQVLETVDLARQVGG